MNRCCEDCALADGYGDCGCKPKRQEGVWECDCWEPLPPEDEEETDGEEEMTNIEMVAAELEAAKKKHPKFVDYFTFINCKTFEPELHVKRSRLEVSKLQGNVMFHDILECEMFEALDAYVHGDLAHAKQELAQCAAVCIRAMEYIDDETNKEINK